MHFAKAWGSRRSKVRLVALLPALALVAAGCAESTTAGSTEGGISVIEEGKLTTCTHLDYKPFQFHKGEEIVGFDVDLVDLIAKEMGLEQQIIDTPFEGIQSGEDLNTSRCDLAAAAMSITETREQNFDFSDPYLDATQALLVKKDSNITSLEQLKGKQLGVQLSTTGEEYAKERSEKFGYKAPDFEDLPLLVTAVQTGDVAAGINDDKVLKDFIQDNPEVKITKEFETGEQYGIGVKTGNDKLRNKINETLAKLKKNGEYDRIHEKWFGEKPE